MVLLLGLTLVLLTGRGNSILRAFGNRLPGSLTRFIPHVPSGGMSGLWLPLGLAVVFQMCLVCTNVLIGYTLHAPLAFSVLLWIVAVVSLLQAYQSRLLASACVKAPLSICCSFKGSIVRRLSLLR